jgi:hypothetical protein
LQRLYVAVWELGEFVFHNFTLRHNAALVGAAERCDLLILILKTRLKDRSLVSLDSSYNSPHSARIKKRPDVEHVRAFC